MRELDLAAPAELCGAAELAEGSTLRQCFRSLIGIITELRSTAKQPVGVRVNWETSDKAQRILSDLIWLGSAAAYPTPADLEFLVSTCVILPRSHYGEKVINQAHDTATAEVLRKLMAD